MKQVTIYEDMYMFYKDTKSKRLLASFIEYLFEGIEPTGLKGIEKTIFNSLKIRMQNQLKKSKSGAIGGSKSHGGGRPQNPSSELVAKTSKQTSKKQANKQAKNKEDNNTNVLLLSNILSNDNIYSTFYGKGKGIDEKVCDKLIDNKLKQGITLDDIRKGMIIYNCEQRLKQDWDHVKKFETWIKEYQQLDDEQMDEQIRIIVRGYRNKTESDPKFGGSKVAKTVWEDLLNTFGEDRIRKIWKETRKGIQILTN